MKTRNLDFLGFENYEITDQGNVYSLNYRRSGKRRMLKPKVESNGYLRVMLCNNCKKKLFLIHQLVGKAFLDWSMWGLTQYNHKNEDKTDNRLENIEPCTQLYNNTYGTRIERVSEANKKPIIGVNVKTGDVVEFDSIKDAEMTLNIHNSNISTCLKGRYKTAGGYRWYYKTPTK